MNSNGATPLFGKAGIFMVMLSLLLTACGGAATKEETNADTTASSAPQQEQLLAFDQYSPKFQRILKTYDGTVRGISLGDQVAEVERKETAPPFEGPLDDRNRQLGYTLDLGKSEMTDIFYYFNPKTKAIENITIDTYLNDAQSVDSLMTEVTRYFTDKYGNPVIKETKAVAWQDAQKNKIVVKDVGIKESPGLRIQIAKGN